MRRSIRGKKPRGNRKDKLMHIIRLVMLILLILVIVFFVKQINGNIMPSVLAMAEYKARSVATEIINESVNETLDQLNIDSRDLVVYYYNEKGNVNSFEVDTVKINEISSQLIRAIMIKLENENTYDLNVPIGILTGTKLFANTGPNIKIEIMPIGTATIDYGKDFTNIGINQINNRVWLDIATDIQIVIPLATEQLTINQQITLVDQIYNGEVPGNYVNVPEQNILDAIQN